METADDLWMSVDDFAFATRPVLERHLNLSGATADQRKEMKAEFLAALKQTAALRSRHNGFGGKRLMKG